MKNATTTKTDRSAETLRATVENLLLRAEQAAWRGEGEEAIRLRKQARKLAWG